MMDAIDVILFGLLCFFMGATAGMYALWQQWLNCLPRQINATLVVDHKLMEQLDSAKVEAWLDKRGLTWQRKGELSAQHKAIKE